mmetsp:Transcript_27329/g.90846  ORF Transcript_27329/g.90846 Transcript_27329/m.90846 type:complete len:277 (-) Transcript_27329:2077-2907(-)
MCSCAAQRRHERERASAGAGAERCARACARARAELGGCAAGRAAHGPSAAEDGALGPGGADKVSVAAASPPLPAGSGRDEEGDGGEPHACRLGRQGARAIRLRLALGACRGLRGRGASVAQRRRAALGLQERSSAAAAAAHGARDAELRAHGARRLGQGAEVQRCWPPCPLLHGPRGLPAGHAPGRAAGRRAVRGGAPAHAAPAAHVAVDAQLQHHRLREAHARELGEGLDRPANDLHAHPRGVGSGVLLCRAPHQCAHGRDDSELATGWLRLRLV